MRLISLICFLVSWFSFAILAVGQSSVLESESYLSWTAAQVDKIGKSTRESGKAGSSVNFRGLGTDRAINYKLRATLMTPEVIRASARYLQLSNRLTDDQTRKIVVAAETVGNLVVMIEIDPNEGSGVIPLDWRIFLEGSDSKSKASGSITGIKSPNFRSVQALSGLYRRDYDYDVFWVSFPLVDENKLPLLAADIAEIQLVVRIYQKEGRISWRMPVSLREKIKESSKR